MGSRADVPADVVPAAIAEVEADGTLAPRTAAMQAWVERMGNRLDALPVDGEQRAALLAGDKVVAHHEGCWQLQRIERDGVAWLVVEDVSDREALQRVTSSTARCRLFGRLAARLAHDLNNQFNAALALAAQAMLDCDDDAEREAIRDIERGAKSGARMVSVLARTLSRSVRHRESVEPAQVCEDALAMVRKSLQVDGVEVDVQVAEQLPMIKVESIDAVNAIMNGMLALHSVGAEAIECQLRAASHAVGDGQPRAFVELRCAGAGVDAAAADALVATITMSEGALVKMARNMESLDGMATAAIQQLRWGGELQAVVQGPSLVLTYYWPAF